MLILKSTHFECFFIKKNDICYTNFLKLLKMAMNKNTVLAWATVLMTIMGVVLILMGAYRYDEVAGWGFATVGIGFFAIAWVFNALKGRV